MSISDPETSSLHDDLSSALEATETSTGTLAADPALTPDPAAATTTAALPEFKIPEKWPARVKEEAARLLALPDGTGRAAVEAWFDHDKSTRGYITRVEQERAQLRQQFDPIRQVIEPYAQSFQLNGMSTQDGLRQVLGVMDYFNRDPAGAIKWLAQSGGVDLAKLIEQQPYVPPEFSALEQRLNQFEQRQSMAQFQQQQAYKAAVERSVGDQLKAFETATDASGQPKWPHYDRLQDEMAAQITAAHFAGKPMTLETAYQRALQLDPDLQKEQAQKQAQAEAAKRAAEAAKAVGASRTVKAKGTAGAVPERSLREELQAQLGAAGMA